MVTAQTVVQLASYLTKIHHVKGRIRVRVNPKIKQKSSHITVADIESLPQKIKGIKTITIKKSIGSVTVTYDNDIFPYELWEDLVAQRNTQKIVEILNSLAKEVV